MLDHYGGLRLCVWSDELDRLIAQHRTLPDYTTRAEAILREDRRQAIIAKARLAFAKDHAALASAIAAFVSLVMLHLVILLARRCPRLLAELLLCLPRSPLNGRWRTLW